ncbi:RIC1-domain-containing protein [Wallemia mellicola]|nr:RIC1-domain-containing protein [Wallemia mellicola]
MSLVNTFKSHPNVKEHQLRLHKCYKIVDDIFSYEITYNDILIATKNYIKIITVNKGVNETAYQNLSWLESPDSPICHISFSQHFNSFIFISQDGHAYYAHLDSDWKGCCIAKPPTTAVVSSFNEQFSLVSIGTSDGKVLNFAIRPNNEAPIQSHTFSENSTIGAVKQLNWTHDGYALAIAYENSWSIRSIYGRILVPTSDDLLSFIPNSSQRIQKFQDRHIWGLKNIFWGTQSLEIYLLIRNADESHQLFVIPLAKSAVTTQHSPDNTRYAFLQMYDKLLVYRGADQSDLSVINPESDVWESIKIPLDYLHTQFPIKYSSISSNGKFVAVAGRNGLAHYSTTSKKWKLFNSEVDEQSFSVSGGMVWFNHILIASVITETNEYQLRLYSRDQDLSTRVVLYIENIPSRILLTSLFENALLVYTADNTIHHYLITPTNDSITLNLANIISFQGVVSNPTRVRGMSWMIPPSQRKLGDPIDDLTVATIIFLIDGKLVLLRPRRIAQDQVKYDMQVLSDGIEYYWTHLNGIGALENSLWGVDGQGIRLWLDALTLTQSEREKARNSQNSNLEIVKESVRIELDFYPLSVLMDKGILIGVDHEASLRGNLPFISYKIHTNTHLFLHHTIRFYLMRGSLKEAVIFANNYSDLVYFPHTLEILLHSVLEEEADADVSNNLLPLVIEFLDHWDCALQVVVGCARKTEMSRWSYLFDVVGAPRELFEKCLKAHQLKTASSYLLVLHHLEQLEGTDDAFKLLHKALVGGDLILSKEIIRFLHSIDPSGVYMQNIMDLIDNLKNTLPEISNNIPVNGLSQLDEEDEYNLSLQRTFSARKREGLGITLEEE